MRHFRKELLFLCDSFILFASAFGLGWFALRYSIPGALVADQLVWHVLLLFACTTAFQFCFHTYDSLWRYAESREYLFLLLAALSGFCVYEVIARYILKLTVMHGIHFLSHTGH